MTTTADPQDLQISPDPEGISDQALAHDPGVFIVIDSMKGVPQPISGTLSKLGVASLREKVGDPVSVAGQGSIKEAPGHLLNGLDELRSERFRKTFHKRLNELRVDSELVRNNWFARVSKITVVRVADDVQATYRLRRRLYSVPAQAGFDPKSETFWVKGRPQSAMEGFYEAIAAQLVFKSIARPVDLLALERALRVDFRESSFGTYAFGTEEPEDDPVKDGGSHGEQGEAILGHYPFEPDSSRNVPNLKPQPLSPVSKTKRQAGEPSRKGKDEGADNRTPPLENEHKTHLKSEYYASHCQMCLCENSPIDLAPVGSYVQWAEVRRHIIQAHHVDPKPGGGARHAGNLLLLCKFHHDNYGSRLTREAVTAALKETQKPKIVQFTGNDDCEEVTGQVTEVVISDDNERIAIFFRKEHIDFWLSVARSDS